MKKLISLAAMIVLLSGFLIAKPMTAAEPALLKVSMLNIGQGDSFFIQAPNGSQVLIDGGRPDNKVLGELAKVMPAFDRSIDVMVATHPDSDHIGGLEQVLKRYKVGLFLTSQEGDTSVSKAVFEAYRSSDAKGFYARHGLHITLDKAHGVVADILFPDRDVHGWETNAGSVVVRLSYGSKSFLFTGDSPSSVEHFLVQTEPKAIDVDVLKLGHHGSKFSSSTEYLKATSPSLALISAGINNTYGHPNVETMARLKVLAIPFLNTQIDGTVTLVTDGNTITRQK